MLLKYAENTNAGILNMLCNYYIIGKYLTFRVFGIWCNLEVNTSSIYCDYSDTFTCREHSFIIDSLIFT